MESTTDYGPRILGENKLVQLKQRVLEDAKVDSPQLIEADPKEVDKILNRALQMLQEFESAAIPHPHNYQL